MTIDGGLQRRGALRAVSEALSDRMSNVEFSQLSIAGLVRAIMSAYVADGAAIARTLGELCAYSSNDPADWPENIRRTIPTTFAAELIGSARRSANPSWAARAARWSLDETWLDAAFPVSMVEYLRRLGELAREIRDDPTWLEAGTIVA